MKDIVEIRWHGRGGQGAKTASLLLADAAFNTGKYVQGFPEYGPERMGAPITAYNRISSERSTVHSNIYFPDYVVVVDETLLSAVDVTAGLKKEGAIVINSSKSPAELRPLLKRGGAGQELPQHPHAGRHREGQRRHRRGGVHQGHGGFLQAQVRQQAPGHRGQHAGAEEISGGGAGRMSHLAKDMTPDVTWKDITPGCNIYEGGTSSVVETGDWRTMKPVIDWDKCKQCLLCAPVCPDMSIPVNQEGKREDFDYFFCKGCGICANTCPFGAITMVKDEK